MTWRCLPCSSTARRACHRTGSRIRCSRSRRSFRGRTSHGIVRRCPVARGSQQLHLESVLPAADHPRWRRSPRQSSTSRSRVDCWRSCSCGMASRRRRASSSCCVRAPGRWRPRWRRHSGSRRSMWSIATFRYVLAVRGAVSGVFATPVAYPASLVPEVWRPLYGLNPMATIVEGFRWGLLGTPCPGSMAAVLNRHRRGGPGWRHCVLPPHGRHVCRCHSDVALRVRGLGKRYESARGHIATGRCASRIAASVAHPWRRLLGREPVVDRRRSMWALEDVSFDVRRGEVLGIIGGNGAGKSTLLKILSRITDQPRGRPPFSDVSDRCSRLARGFHPELTGRENIYLNGAILGMRKAEIDRKFDDIVAFAEVDAFVDTPVRHYRAELYVQARVRVAAQLRTRDLIIDEVSPVATCASRRSARKINDVARGGRTVRRRTHPPPRKRRCHRTYGRFPPSACRGWRRSDRCSRGP